MSIIKENIIERYVHFIIVGAAGVISLALLLLFVFRSPNAVELNGTKVGPGEIDQKIKLQAARIDTELDKEPEKKPAYQEKSRDFQKIFAMSLKDYDGLELPIPGSKATMDAILREYGLPVVGQVEDVRVNYMRTIGFVPLFAVSDQLKYAQAEVKPDNLDLVTVQARFDVDQLKANLEDVFASKDIKREWRDKSLARPIFAKVELERQQMNADGSWGDWEIVPRTKINEYAELFEFSDQIDQIRQGVDVLKIQFQSNEILKSLLQPQPYDIAEADMQWYPPSIFNVYQKLKLEQERQRLKEEKEKAKGTTATRERRPRNERTAPAESPAAPGMGPGFGPAAPADDRSSRRTRDDRRKEKDDTSAVQKKQEDPEQIYQKILIANEVMPWDLNGQIAFWAHDDSAEPGFTYRYRIRLGIFNPVAGQNWYTQENAEYNSKAILWSAYSNETESVFIPGKEYIFAIDKNPDDSVRVQVSKLILGNWRSHEFVLREGEPIGEIIEEAVLKSESQNQDTRTPAGQIEASVQETEEIDYRTGAKFVGIEETEGVINIGGTEREVKYYQMIYTYDGVNMLKIGIKDRFWPEDVKKAYTEIKNSQKKIKEVLPSRGSSGTRQQAPGVGPGFGPGMMGPGMMGPGF